MLLYIHPLHDAAVAAGRSPVNSVWLGGCGPAQPVDPAAVPDVIETLRRPALAGDWTAWAEAWSEVDRHVLGAALEAARRGAAVTVTLCGERTWLRLQPPSGGWWSRLSLRLRGTDPADLLATL